MLIYTSRKSRCSSAGRALPWGGRGRRFKSCHLDQIKPNGFSPFGFISFYERFESTLNAPCALAQRGGRGFPEVNKVSFGGSTVVSRRFKSCHLDQISTVIMIRKCITIAVLIFYSKALIYKAFSCFGSKVEFRHTPC